jgi:hypothetical protein
MPFRSQAQWRWAFANNKPWADRWAKETPQKLTTLSKRARRKAATTGNFSATGGQQIGGQACRDENGKFANCDKMGNIIKPGSSMAAYEQSMELAKMVESEEKKIRKAQLRAEMGLDTGGGGTISPAERKRRAREEQKKQESLTHASVGPGASLGAALSNFADPDNPGRLPNLIAMRLQELGLAEQSSRTGEWFITGAGRSYINAARSGDMSAAREAFERARDDAIMKREQEAADAEQAAIDEQLQAQADYERAVIESMLGSPFEQKLTAAQEKLDRRARAARGQAKKPARESNRTYGSGKVVAGSPKSTVKSYENEEPMTQEWLAYQLNGMHTPYWVDSVVSAYEKSMRNYKSDKPEIDRKPSQSASTNAIRGLDLQFYFKRGGSSAMISLARKIANRSELSDDDIRTMHAYLQRHTGDRTDDWGNRADPSAAYINWMMHGGDDGLNWSSEQVDKMRLKREKPTSLKASRADILAKGRQRNQGAGGDFALPAEKRFPVTDYGSITDAINSWPQYRGLSSYEDFKKGLMAAAQRKGLTAALPNAWRKEIEASAKSRQKTVDRSPIVEALGGNYEHPYLNGRMNAPMQSQYKHMRGRHDQRDHAWNRGMGRGGGGTAAAASSPYKPKVNMAQHRADIVSLQKKVDAGEMTYHEMRNKLRDNRGYPPLPPRTRKQLVQDGKALAEAQANIRPLSPATSTPAAPTLTPSFVDNRSLEQVNRERAATGLAPISEAERQARQDEEQRDPAAAGQRQMSELLNRYGDTEPPAPSVSDTSPGASPFGAPQQSPQERRQQLLSETNAKREREGLPPLSMEEFARTLRGLPPLPPGAPAGGPQFASLYGPKPNPALQNLGRDILAAQGIDINQPGRFGMPPIPGTGYAPGTRENPLPGRDALPQISLEQFNRNRAARGAPPVTQAELDAIRSEMESRLAVDEFDREQYRGGIQPTSASLGGVPQDTTGPRGPQNSDERNNLTAYNVLRDRQRARIERGMSTDQREAQAMRDIETRLGARRDAVLGFTRPEDLARVAQENAAREAERAAGAAQIRADFDARQEQVRADQAAREARERQEQESAAAAREAADQQRRAEIAEENQRREAERQAAAAEMRAESERRFDRVIENNPLSTGARRRLQDLLAQRESLNTFGSDRYAQLYPQDNAELKRAAESLGVPMDVMPEMMRRYQAASDNQNRQRAEIRLQEADARTAAEPARRAQYVKDNPMNAYQRNMLRQQLQARSTYAMPGGGNSQNIRDPYGYGILKDTADKMGVSIDQLSDMADLYDAKGNMQGEQADRAVQSTIASHTERDAERKRQAQASVSESRRQQILSEAKRDAENILQPGAGIATASAQNLERYAQELGVSVEELNAMIFGGMLKSTVKAHAGGKDSFSPPAGVRAAAKRGLELRSKFGRGGTSVGIARARDLSNGKGISASTIRRMNSFFARHAVDKRPDWSNPSKPSNGYIAHLLWGGDAGRAWASKISRHLDAKKKEYPSYVFNSHIDIYRHRNDEMLRKEQQRHNMQYSIKARRQNAESTIKAFEYETTKGKNKPSNPSLWSKAVAEAKKKYRVYPSAYANGYAAKWYKKNGGTWKTEKDLREWFSEKWVDISRPKKGGGYEPCGRRTEGMSESDYRKKYPKCVPASRAAKMTDAQKRSAIANKREEGLPKGGAPQNVATLRKTKGIISAIPNSIKAVFEHKKPVSDSSPVGDWVDITRHKPNGAFYLCKRPMAGLSIAQFRKQYPMCKPIKEARRYIRALGFSSGSGMADDPISLAANVLGHNHGNHFGWSGGHNAGGVGGGTGGGAGGDSPGGGGGGGQGGGDGGGSAGKSFRGRS